MCMCRSIELLFLVVGVVLASQGREGERGRFPERGFLMFGGVLAADLGMLCCRATVRQVANETLDSQRSVSFSRRGASSLLE